ncbi:GSCFA domain-containing protein [Maribacter sp. 2-571]|uniref:GSCFA domain-containing protein n=1 Tax=Maribacter sp. 2-571 TaxID=3417569 RepID=UPI003D3580C7
MRLQTQVPIPQAKGAIDYQSRIVLLGSCFSDHMGGKLERYRFRTLQNPFGILFHPRAIENFLERAVRAEMYGPEALFFDKGQWHCFDAHSEHNDSNEKQVLQKLNGQLKTTRAFLGNATHVFITLGTAWTYRHLKTDTTVANCHKVPQKEFAKELLSISEITASLENIISTVRSLKQGLKVVFTVSPVRHLKDGFVENQRSKAHLLSAVHEVLGKATFGDNSSYFPSYEIQMDELRDYRFYGPDMVHPSPVAVDYIWEKFKGAYITYEARATMDAVETVQKGLEHRPFHPNSEEHQQFLRSLSTKITYLKEKHPWMAFPLQA